MYIPEDRDFQMEIVHWHHDTPIPGHPRTEKTLELMQYSYTWPGMLTLVKDYISRCDCCTRFKGSNQAPPGKLKLLDTPPGSWKEISANFITDLPESEGFDSILVVVDQFSKEVEFILKWPNSLKSWLLLEQGGDLCQWHSMANWRVEGETLCSKSEDGKSPSEQDWGKPVECAWALYAV